MESGLDATRPTRPLRSAVGSELAHSWPSAAPALVAATLIVALSWKAGGYFAPAYLEAGVAAYLVIAVVLVARPPRFRLSTSALLGLGSLTALTAWTGLSSGWSSTPSDALSEMQRGFTYIALLGLGVLAAGSGRFTRQLVWLVLAALTVVAAGALLSRLYPDLVPTPDFRPGGSYRLAYPLTYPNALGAMVAMGAVLGAGLAGNHREVPLARALAAMVAVALAVVMYLTLSRTAWLALIVAAVILVCLARRRLPVVTSLGLVAAGTAILLLGLSAYPALTEDPRLGEGQAAAGHEFSIAFAIVLAAVGCAQLLLARRRWRGPPALRALKRISVPAAVATLVVGAVFYLADARAVEGRASGALVAAERFAQAQWRDFASPTLAVPVGPERLETARTSRADLYRVAVGQFRAHPVRGEGAGSFQVSWIRERRVELGVRDAHSVYLETLGELGLVGIALLLGLIASMVFAVARSRRRPGGLGRSETAAVAAALTVWLVSSAVDWNWQMPALTGAAFVLGATVYPYGRRIAEAPGQARRRTR